MRSGKRLAVAIAGLCCAGALAATNDPMRPLPRPGSVSAPAPVRPAPAPRRHWVLSSTLVGETRRVAVINDRLVGVGDSVLGATVIDISPRSARLRYAGSDVLLRLGGADRQAKPRATPGRQGAEQ